MTTHIRKLRPYTYNGETRLADKTYLNMFCQDINYLFNEGLQKLLERIPPEERYNLYYTACSIEERDGVTKQGKKYTNKRAFVDQEIIPFDIDHVCLPQIDDYPPVIAHALGLPLDQLIVVYTGNGIQVVAKSAERWTDASYFETHRQGYANLCTKIQSSLTAQGLAGDVDTSVWSPARLLRLPDTENRKPMLTPHAPDVIIKQASLTKWHHLSGAGILLEKDTPLTKYESAKYQKDNSYLRPDAQHIRAECLFIKGCLDGTIDVHEPECYAFLGVAAFLEDDDQTANEGLQRFSSPTIDKMDKQAKLEQAREASGPRTCEDISGRCDLCQKCPYRTKITTPLQIRRPDFNLSLAYSGELGDKPYEIEVVAFCLSRLKIPFDTTTGKVDRQRTLILREGDNPDPTRRDYFFYTGKYWEPVTQATLQDISALIRKAYGHKASDAKVIATLKALLNLIPINEDQSMFHQKIDKANFQNGTLHAIPNGNGTYRTEFHPHNKEDKLTYILPTDYNRDLQYSDAGEFGKMLQRIFSGDPDTAQKIESLQQAFGMSIMPIFPRIFFLVGKSGSGKSTILKIMSNFIGLKNLAFVEITGKNDFNLEDLAGKNVNMVSDIDENEPIRANIIKQIEDRHPVRIQRKFRSSLIVPLPAAHFFGANKLPPIVDSSGAMNRRVSTIVFNNSFTQGEEYMRPEERKSIKDIANIIWEQDKENIMAFVQQGIINILEKSRGHYINSESGIQLTKEWLTERDECQQFLDAIKEGEIENLGFGEGMTERGIIYQSFCDWCIMEHGGNTNIRLMTRNRFYKKLEQKGHANHRYEHGRFIKGIIAKNNVEKSF